ncbi:hypothetical protein N7488_005097 [Penicillium malachiteum]|nr:hypothetical protein N7488_005097 [Penicillium malachiteum]
MSQNRERSVTIKTEPGKRPAEPSRHSAARSQPSRSAIRSATPSATRSATPAIKTEPGTNARQSAASTSEPSAKRRRTSRSTNSTSTASSDRSMPPPSQSRRSTSASHRSPSASNRPAFSTTYRPPSSRFSSRYAAVSSSFSPIHSPPAQPTASQSRSIFRSPSRSSIRSSIQPTASVTPTPPKLSVLPLTSSTRSIRFRFRQVATDDFLDIPLNDFLTRNRFFDAAHAFYQRGGSSSPDLSLQCRIPATNEVRWIVNDDVIFDLLCEDLRALPANGDLLQVIEVTPNANVS